MAPLQIPAAMPPVRHQQVDLASIAREAATYGGGEDAPPVAPSQKEYDVFICHASEDKDDVARPLAEALKAAGLDVWFDEFELRIGSSLRRNIDMGLVHSRFGVVILSPAFFEKGWSNYELDGLVTREVGGRRPNNLARLASRNEGRGRWIQPLTGRQAGAQYLGLHCRRDRDRNRGGHRGR